MHTLAITGATGQFERAVLSHLAELIPANTREFVTGLAAGAAAMIWPSLGRAEDPIALLKILFGYPPGGAGELVTRGLGMKMTPGYAKAAIVDAKPGAAGRLVMEAIESAPTDGSTVLVTPSSVVSMYPHVYSKLSYAHLRTSRRSAGSANSSMASPWDRVCLSRSNH